MITGLSRHDPSIARFVRDRCTRESSGFHVYGARGPPPRGEFQGPVARLREPGVRTEGFDPTLSGSGGGRLLPLVSVRARLLSSSSAARRREEALHPSAFRRPPLLSRQAWLLGQFSL